MKKLLCLTLMMAGIASAEASENPTPITVTDVTTTSAVLTWAPVPNVSSYTIWELQSGSYGQIWMPIANSIPDTRYFVDLTNVACRGLRVQSDDPPATWPDTVTACALVPSGTTYTLPDPAVTVSPNTTSGYTVVTARSQTYKGPSAYVYVSECATADIPYKYRCDILRENGVVLTAPSGATVVVSITYQQAYTLIRSGRIYYWRPSQVVLYGTVTTP